MIIEFFIYFTFITDLIIPWYYIVPGIQVYSALPVWNNMKNAVVLFSFLLLSSYPAIPISNINSSALWKKKAGNTGPARPEAGWYANTSIPGSY